MAVTPACWPSAIFGSARGNTTVRNHEDAKIRKACSSCASWFFAFSWFPRVRSEHQPESEAHRPLIGRTAVAVDDGGNLPEVRRIEIPAGTIEVRRVQDVEHISPYLTLDLARKREELRNGHVQIPVGRAVEHAVARGSA